MCKLNQKIYDESPGRIFRSVTTAKSSSHLTTTAATSASLITAKSSSATTGKVKTVMVSNILIAMVSIIAT